MEKGCESGTSPAAYPTWDIRSNTCALTISFTHIFSTLLFALLL
jgi:hypothetical protein